VEEIMFSKTASTTPTYYSNAISAINNLADKNPKNTQGWIKQLTDTQKNGGIKNVNQELEWIGLEDYLNEYVKENSPKAGNIPSSVVEDYIKSNQIDIVEVSKGTASDDMSKPEVRDEFYNEAREQLARVNMLDQDAEETLDIWSANPTSENFQVVESLLNYANIDLSYIYDKNSNELNNATKYSGYQLKGGENYREVLLTMPSENATKLARRKELADIDRNRQLTQEEQSEYLLLQANIKGEAGTYKSSHWDEANILAHVRLNEKTLPDGRKVLIVNEMQSDWAQEGRKTGFKDAEKEAEREALRLKIQVEKNKVRDIESRLANLKPLTQEEKFELNQQKLKLEEARNNVRNNREWNALGEEVTKIEEKLDEYENTKSRLKSDIYSLKYEGDNSLGVLEEELYNFDKENKDLFNKVEQMPYKNTDQWLGLATRRVLQMAAQEGYDGVSFATGQQSADMYSLAKQVDNISWDTTDNTLTAFDKNGNQQFQQSNVTDDRLEDFVGKEVAQKLVSRKENLSEENEGVVNLENADLEIGGEGMKAFYDKILPKVAQKEAQRFDKSSKLETVDLTGEPINTNYRFQDVRDISFNGRPFQRYIRDQDGSWYMTVSNLQMAIEDDMSELLLRNNFKTLEEAKEAAKENDEDGIAVVRIFEQGIKDHDLLNGKDISDLDIEYYQTAELEKDKLALAEQPFIAITDKMRSELGKAIPMFSKNQGQEAPREVLDQVTDRLEQSGLASNVYKMTNAQIEAKLIEFGVTPTVLDIYISKGKVIVEC
jgi:hypothetical protein